MTTITGFPRPIGCAFVPGGEAGEHQVQGKIGPGATLLAVQYVQPGTPPTATDLTDEFAIHATKGGVIENDETDTTGGWLHVLWVSQE